MNSSPEQIVSAPVKESLPEVEKAVEEKSSAPVVEKKEMAPQPRKMPNVSPFAQGIIDQLELAVAEKDGGAKQQTDWVDEHREPRERHHRHVLIRSATDGDVGNEVAPVEAEVVASERIECNSGDEGVHQKLDRAEIC